MSADERTIKNLGDLLSLEYGSSLPADARSGQGYPVYGSSGEVGRHEHPLVSGPGIVVGRKGTVGAIVWSAESFWPIDTTYYVVPKQRLDQRWCYWLMRHLPLERLDSSTGVPGLNRNDVYSVSVEVPPLREQRRIAEILDAADAAIAETEALISKLKRIKTGLMHDLLTCGLDERGGLRDPDAHPEQFKDSPLGRIPREWETLTVNQVLANREHAMRSGPFGSALLKHELVSSGVPLLGIDNVYVERFVDEYKRFVSYDKFLELRRYQVFSGDVLVTIMGTVGRSCVVPEHIPTALSSKHVWTLSLNPDLYVPSLLCTQINHASWVRQHFLSRGQGSTMDAISSSTLRSTLIPVPPLNEQQRIIEILDAHDNRIRAEEAYRDKLKLQKAGLMEDLLTGKVRVNTAQEVGA